MVSVVESLGESPSYRDRVSWVQRKRPSAFHRGKMFHRLLSIPPRGMRCTRCEQLLSSGNQCHSQHQWREFRWEKSKFFRFWRRNSKPDWPGKDTLRTHKVWTWLGWRLSTVWCRHSWLLEGCLRYWLCIRAQFVWKASAMFETCTCSWSFETILECPFHRTQPFSRCTWCRPSDWTKCTMSWHGTKWWIRAWKLSSIGIFQFHCQRPSHTKRQKSRALLWGLGEWKVEWDSKVVM